MILFSHLAITSEIKRRIGRDFSTANAPFVAVYFYFTTSPQLADIGHAKNRNSQIFAGQKHTCRYGNMFFAITPQLK